MNSTVKENKSIIKKSEPPQILDARDQGRNMTPKEIVAHLDKYIVSQNDAKRSVAIALRNRWRRQQLPPEMRDEVAPKNIVMIGPTGVGKTEIARRLSKLVCAPFIKVEASKFTEVGYVGRDVESIIRDLTHLAVNMVREEQTVLVEKKAEAIVEERLLDLLLPPTPVRKREADDAQDKDVAASHEKNTREKFRKWLLDGKFEDKIVEVEVQQQTMPMIEIFSNVGMEEVDLKDMLPPNLFPSKSKKHKMSVQDARKTIFNEEVQKLIDMDAVVKMAVERVEQSGIVFLDEIDKIAGRGSAGHGPDISREGVQRDLLPIVEGCTVSTKYGMVKSDHILFISAGAFHSNKPSDMIPELQGRFPIRVELKSLSKEDFVRILVEPRNALSKQYVSLMATEGVELEFTDDAIEEIAHLATAVNDTTENIGARRLYTLLEKLLDEISFDAPEMGGQSVSIDAAYVRDKLADIASKEDLSRYIL